MKSSIKVIIFESDDGRFPRPGETIRVEWNTYTIPSRDYAVKTSIAGRMYIAIPLSALTFTGRAPEGRWRGFVGTYE